MDSVRRLRMWAESHPVTLDVLIVLLALGVHVGGVASISASGDNRNVDALAIALLVFSALAVYWRRVRPIASLAVASFFVFSYWVLDYPDAGGGFALVILLYSVARYAERRHSTQALVAFTTALLLVLMTGYFYSGEQEVTGAVIATNLILFQLVWIGGDTIRNRIDSLAEMDTRLRSAEASQLARTQTAVANERTRIARELHDIMAHSMSVIVVQAEGAKRLVGSDDETVSEVLTTIEKTARANLNDLRGVVGLLRADDPTRSPAPELSMVEALVRQCGEAGLPVDLAVKGERRTLPQMIELSGYRIVQESLTNALKHAGPGAAAKVTLSYEAGALKIQVVDDGRGAAGASATPGHGLVGMRERVEAFGGQLHAGPRTGGGFGVEARLPVAAE